MAKVTSSDIVFFFGAGASAPFGIPTMKQFVVEFEKYLNENAEKSERTLYSDIKTTLNEKLGKEVDLEGVFTVIDGIINYTPERLGLLSLYLTESRRNFPNMEICKNLKEKFQKFVKEKCVIPAESYGKIQMVYQDFFNRIAVELGEKSSKRDYAWNTSWTIFTTNYDNVLNVIGEKLRGLKWILVLNTTR